MNKRFVGFALFSIVALFFALRAQKADAQLPWQDARQMVLVIVPDWDSTTGTLQKFEHENHGWKAVGTVSDIAIGHGGTAWGTGLHPAQSNGPQKHEGDGRSPAGVFTLGKAFGYAATAATKMPYLALSDSDYCIDSGTSPLYNQIVDTRKVGADAQKDSTEPMRRDIHVNGDQRYREGLVIQNNPHNVPGYGSCIFAHLWKAPGEATTGCTAMASETMDKLLAWLKPEEHPVFVLLPRAEYVRLKHEWQLP
jgi:L,D-peptidoglycan transpeptidase YkuD (ErfK/YbiS/YcfS/YnhG family)